MSIQTQEEKFIAVLQQHKKIIYKVCSFYCSNKHDREDLAQEIVIQLWRSFDKYDDQYSLSTWIYRIALNVAISDYRKTRKSKPFAVSINMPDIADETAAVEELENDIARLHHFISQLDQLNKALMILYLDNNSYQKIAEIVGITETNVATKISRIKKKLKQQFEFS